MPRPLIPDDDLYARLELRVDATAEEVELAWRSLLRRHHPDVARDPDAVDRAKRINVAHDWLGNPDLRARYDRERLGVRHRGFHPRRSRGGVREDRPTGGPGAPRAPRRPPPPGTPPLTPAQRLDRFLARVGSLTEDELDRLAVAEPPPIAFLATLRRFLTDADRAELDRVDALLAARVPTERWANLPIREALRAVAAEHAVGGSLDDLLGGPFRVRARERLMRAWEASIDQRRYGPNTAEVEALRRRISRLEPDEIRAFVGASAGIPAADRPWPARLDPETDEGLRVSAALADRDVATAAAARAPNLRAQRLLGRLGHVVALRHAFTPREYDALLLPWHRATIAASAPGAAEAAARVRRAAG
ncbi:MAG TPA: DnaJ domain-containing protein [Candidatus Limnocylindrales bacterium]|nr:DnaJ domain-containing protein [Candidatus Limnocylindrales bacterium]